MKGIMKLFTLVLLVVSQHATAVVETYQFTNEVDHQRYQALIEELRCPKCQNQNLTGSDAPIAEDLRREVHRLITTGSSDQEILQYMLDRYGDFVLYRPRFTTNTLALWLGPVILVLMGLGIWWRLSRAERA
ncbi:MAG: cytochrome c-type biogenesis protein CcmH, partial [Bermanella sp.]